jgi:hypothetical protein
VKAFAGQSPHEDEDPSLLVHPNGDVDCYFFSNRPRDGSRCRDLVRSRNFGPLEVLTDGDDRDVYPNAVLGRDGELHLCWFSRPHEIPPPERFGHEPAWIMHNGERVTRGSVDWVPAIGIAEDGEPLIAFTSRFRDPGMVWRIYWTKRTADGWSEPQCLSPGSHHDNLPALGSRLDLAWNRNPLEGDKAAWERHDTEIWLARRAGEGWGEPQRIATGDANVFPWFFTDHDGVEWLSWQHDRDGRSTVRAARVDNTDTVCTLPVGIAGYDPRIARLPTRDDYVAVWVARNSTRKDDLDVVYEQFNWRPM